LAHYFIKAIILEGVRARLGHDLEAGPLEVVDKKVSLTRLKTNSLGD
jgi:hypothetical protein